MYSFKKLFSFIVVISILMIFPFQESLSQAFRLKDKSIKPKPEPTKTLDAKSLDIMSQRISNLINKHFPDYFSKNEKSRLPACIQSSKEVLINSENLSLSPNSMNARTVYRNKFGTPSFITDFTPVVKNKNNEQMQASDVAMNLIKANCGFMMLKNPSEELIPAKESRDKEGNFHLVYEQRFNNIPVWGKEITIHLDKNNNVYLINASHVPSPERISLKEKISVQQATDLSLLNLGNRTKIQELNTETKLLLGYNGPKTEKCIWVDAQTGNTRLAWFIQIRPDIIHNWFYFVDAENGEILESFDNSPSEGPATATARDISGADRTINTYQYQGNYYMWDASRPMFRGTMPNADGLVVTYTNNNGDYEKAWAPKPFSTSNNIWSDPASVSSHYFTGLIYEYYKNTHNRNSLDDKGMDMITVLHATQGGQSIDNAWWNGKWVTLGDGGQTTTPWPGALDFIAHEFTHGVVTFTVDLVYKFQSGALNEAFADWGGAMVDRGNWKLGENIARTSFYPSGCVRDMADPHNGGSQGDQGVWLPAHMNEFMDLPLERDNGGVHYNCGIINKATYLIGTAITREKLEKIYYRVLNNKYINKEAKFIDMRLACVKSAEELYGANSSEVNAVKKAFDDVGITDGKGTNPNPDKPKIEGTEWIAVVGQSDHCLYKVKPVIVNQSDIVKLSSTPMYTSSGGVITIPDNGSFILFIDEENYVKFVKPDGTGEDYVSTSGNWASVAISPDGRYLAAIAVADEPKIYLFDLQTSSSTTIDVYIPSTTSTSLFNLPLEVGSLSWNNNGRFLIYDAKNYELKLDGTEVIYWDINMVDMQKGVVFRVFPPQPEGIHIGDPSFSKNSEYLFVFDLYNDVSMDGLIKGANLFNGEIGTMVTFNGATELAGYGNYSIDDNRVVFQALLSDGVYYIMQVPLDAKKINASAQPASSATAAGLPKWFAIGSRPNETEREVPELANFLYIKPNPVISECDITVNTEGCKHQSLIITDVLGNEVMNFNDNLTNGINLLRWNGTNKSGNKVPAGYYRARLSFVDSDGNQKTQSQPFVLIR